MSFKFRTHDPISTKLIECVTTPIYTNPCKKKDCQNRITGSVATKVYRVSLSRATRQYREGNDNFFLEANASEFISYDFSFGCHTHIEGLSIKN